MSQMTPGETRQVAVRHATDRLEVMALLPDVYHDGNDYVSVVSGERQPSPEGSVDVMTTVHAVRSDLLAALHAVEPGAESARVRDLEGALAAAQQNAQTAEAKHGEVVGRLARREADLEQVRESNRLLLRERNAARATLAEVEQQRDANAEALEGAVRERRALSARLGEAQTALHEAGSQVNDLTEANADLGARLESMTRSRDEGTRLYQEALADLARERRAHALLADASREAARNADMATRGGYTADEGRAMRELLEDVAIVVGYSGDLDGIPQAVSRRVGEVLRQVQYAQEQASRTEADYGEMREANGLLADTVRQVAAVVGFPAPSPTNRLELPRLVEFVKAQGANLGRRASDAEDRLLRIASALGCEPGAEVVAVHGTVSRLTAQRDRAQEAMLRTQGRAEAAERLLVRAREVLGGSVVIDGALADAVADALDHPERAVPRRPRA